MTENRPTDVILVRAAAGGNSAAFSELAVRYQKRIKALGMSFFHNESDADDFVQDVLLKIYTKLSTFRGDSQFSTWLMRIAYNTAVNSINRRKDYVPLNEDFELVDNDFSPEERQLRATVVEAVRETMKEIPAHFSVCLDLYFFYGMAYNEISIITDLPVNTVKSHIFRAKKLMKQKLEEKI